MVDVFPDGPPLEYWKRAGGRSTVPKEQPAYIRLQMVHVLKDGKARWPKQHGDAVCRNCWLLLTTDPNGCSNLKGHFGSEQCGRTDWIAMLKQTLNAGRRAPPTPSDVSALSTVDRMLLHSEVAIAFAQIGTLPCSLVDNPIFIRLIELISRGSYSPPSARYISSDGALTALKTS